MALNYIWIGFFIIALLVGVVKSLFFGDMEIFSLMTKATFDSAKLGFELSLGLTGILTLWLGIMKIGERAGIINLFAKVVAPLFGKLFPDIPKGHPVTGAIFMNISSNLLGLDNAATPIGLNVMRQLQELNPQKERVSNAMIMFLVINASGLTLIPITIMMYRAQLGAAAPADVFIPILLATTTSTFVAITLVGLRQRINFFDRAFMIPGAVIAGLVAGVIALFHTGSQEEVSKYVTVFSNFLLFGVICCFIITGFVKRINVYDTFIEGAKEGFKTAVTIIPYLVAILVAIGVFRASGAMEAFSHFVAAAMHAVGLDARFVDALPTMIMKPLSGSGARGLMIDTMNTFGADSFAGRLASIVQGSTDTTFYIIALYCGSVAIKQVRYTLGYSLLADLAGMVAAVGLAYVFFS